MLNKISSTILIVLSFSTSGFASEVNESLQKQLLSIKNMSSNVEHSVTCQKLVEISNKVEKELFEKSCPTDSELDFSICQQATDTVALTEEKQLKKILSEVKSINTETCIDTTESMKIVSTSI